MDLVLPLTINASSPELQQPTLQASFIQSIGIVNDSQASVNQECLGSRCSKVVLSAQDGGYDIGASNTKGKHCKTT